MVNSLRKKKTWLWRLTHGEVTMNHWRVQRRLAGVLEQEHAVLDNMVPWTDEDMAAICQGEIGSDDSSSGLSPTSTARKSRQSGCPNSLVPMPPVAENGHKEFEHFHDAVESEEDAEKEIVEKDPSRQCAKPPSILPKHPNGACHPSRHSKCTSQLMVLCWQPVPERLESRWSSQQPSCPRRLPAKTCLSPSTSKAMKMKTFPPPQQRGRKRNRMCDIMSTSKPRQSWRRQACHTAVR